MSDAYDVPTPLLDLTEFDLEGVRALDRDVLAATLRTMLDDMEDAAPTATFNSLV